MLTKFIDTVTTQGLNVDSIIVTKKNEKFEHFLQMTTRETFVLLAKQLVA